MKNNFYYFIFYYTYIIHNFKTTDTRFQFFPFCQRTNDHVLILTQKKTLQFVELKKN